MRTPANEELEDEYYEDEEDEEKDVDEMVQMTTKCSSVTNANNHQSTAVNQVVISTKLDVHQANPNGSVGRTSDDTEHRANTPA